MTDITYYQSDKFAVPVRDYNEILIDETVLSLDKHQEYLFLKPTIFEGSTIIDVSEKINKTANHIAKQDYNVLISGKKDKLSEIIQFGKIDSHLCWKAELVIVGLR